MMWLFVAALLGFLGAWGLGAEQKGPAAPAPSKKIEQLVAAIANSAPAKKVRAAEVRDRFIAACVDEVPQMLDILTLGLSAGLSFDASLALYCDRTHTELSQLMERSRIAWSVGLASRSEALQRLAQTVQSAALERFAAAVSESLTFGVPLVETLVRQSAAIRADHRREVEEAIEKVPVKLLIPLGVLVVPAMLLAVLGPLVASALARAG